MVAAAAVSGCACALVCEFVQVSLCSQSNKVACVTSPACSNAATDVVFLIDGSKSVRPENFELVKKWINQIIDKLDVSDSKAHVGLVQYSSSVKQVRLRVGHLDSISSIPGLTDLVLFFFFFFGCRSSPWVATTTRKT